MADARGREERALTIRVVMVSTVVMPAGVAGLVSALCWPRPLVSHQPPGGEARPVPRDTLAGTAAWLIQKETQDMATRRTEGM